MKQMKNILLAIDRKISIPLCLLIFSIFTCSASFAEEKFPDTETFNTACKLYSTQDFQESEKLFGSVASQTEDEQLKAKALYNQGTALLAETMNDSESNSLGSVTEAIDLLEKSLELTPKNMEAKQNLERALNIAVSSRIEHAEALINEADKLLDKFQAKEAKENCESAKKILQLIEDDLDPNHQDTQNLIDRADGILQMLDRAVEETKQDLEQAKESIDSYDYQSAADVMVQESKERKWAFSIDQELAQAFKEFMQNNQNVLKIVTAPENDENKE